MTLPRAHAQVHRERTRPGARLTVSSSRPPRLREPGAAEHGLLMVRAREAGLAESSLCLL